MNQASSPRQRLLARLAPLALLLAAAGLHAESITLSGGAEVPPVTTSASGSGEITVAPDRSVSGSVKVSGMSPSMAHIHAGAAGKNGQPIIQLSKGAGDSFSVPAGAKLSEAQYADYMAGNLYVNVHSAQHPGGELRGQLSGKPH